MDAVKVFRENRGTLAVIDFANLPFNPKRFFWIFEVPVGTSRAGHAHLYCEQFLICQNSKVRIRITNSKMNLTEISMVPGDSILLPRLTWLELLNFDENAVLGVFASEHYDRSEYIETFDNFILHTSQEN